MRWRTSTWLLAFLLPLALLPGCWGYHTLGDTPGRIRSAAVLPFQNRTLYTGLEFELQDALVKELQAKSAITVVGEAQADALLQGRIIDFGRSVIKQDGGGRDIEFQITVTAGFSLKERHTGKVLIARDAVSVSGTYLLTRGESETTARARALSDLAERIVSMILYGW
jgi:ABC-type amino acid transport substrate-binding protein